MKNYRRHLGPKFSEGARLTWLALASRGLSISRGAALLGWHRGNLARAIYGDSLPGVELLVSLEKALGVSVSAWAQEPTETFVPPALEEEGAA